MINVLLDIFILLVLVAITNSLLGGILLLRGNTLITFALAHSIVFGLIATFIITGSDNILVLFFGAMISGVLVALLVELFDQVELINVDAALGITYLSIFSLGLILYSLYGAHQLFSPNSIVTGSIVLTPFNRLVLNGIDIGPVLTWVLLPVSILTLIFYLNFRRKIEISMFDPTLSKLMGISAFQINLMVTTLVSLATVITFKVAGIIVVVAFFVIPGAVAYLFSNNFSRILISAVFIAVLSTLIGLIFISNYTTVEPASINAIILGVIFIFALFVSPKSKYSDIWRETN